jgi:predicted DCC family thiol-disulfide oxidoreductase YuxK
VASRVTICSISRIADHEYPLVVSASKGGGILMSKLRDRQAYSYLDDPDVPAFDDTWPVVFMDGQCALCTLGARTIARLDRKKEFKICPIQSSVGRAVLQHYGLDPSDPDSWLYLHDGKAETSLDAIMTVGRRLGGIGNVMSAFYVFPRPTRDWLYHRLARNRYGLFGRAEMCALADPELRSRLMQ